MYRMQGAYRHDNGEVEGFVGFGFSEDSAANDCINQMRIKAEAIRGSGPNTGFKRARAILSGDGLTPDELEIIRKDWASNARYNADGTIWRGGNANPGTAGT